MISDNRMEGLLNKVVQGECLEVMKGIPDNSIDLLVTDPPYGIAFMGRHWDKAVPSVEIWKKCLRVLKPGAFVFVMCIPRQDCLARMITNLGDAGFETGFTSMYWAQAQGFPKAMNIGKAIDKQMGQAKALDGSYCGFQPKPAVEVILVAMKPLSEKTYVGQATMNGKGITWLDGCRIPYGNNKDKSRSPLKSDGTKGGKTFHGQFYDNRVQRLQTQGRFPANLLVSDDVLDSELDGLGGYRDTGSFSRYFSLDAWWDKKLKELPESVQKTFPFLIVPKASKGERNKGCEELEERQTLGGGGLTNVGDKFGSIKAKQSNHHPTCKPLKLMCYLVTLGSREGDIILDPFLGSGTTALACKILGRHYIGIERESEYVEISRARLEATETQAQMELVKC